MSKDSLFKKALQVAIGDNAFVNFVAGLGTARDKASAAEFMPTNRMGVKELENVYDGDWVAQRIIDKPAYDCFRAGYYLAGINADQDKAIKRLSKDIGFDDVLIEAVAYARLHGWCYILIGEQGDNDLAEPLENDGIDLSFFSILKRDECKPKTKTTYLSADKAKGKWNEPEYYQLGQDWEKKYIHHSRIVRIDASGLIKDKDGLPKPTLQKIYEAIKQHASVNANASSLVYEAKVDIFKVPGLMTALRTSPMAAVNQMVQRFTSIATMKGNNGMIVLDAEEDYQSKSYSFSGLPQLMQQFQVVTAGAANMPYSLLFGQSVGGLNSSGDFEMRSYYDFISAIQQNEIRQPLEILLSIMAKSLGFTVDDLGLVFNPLWQIDSKVKSEIERANAERDEKYLTMGILTEAQVARQLVDDGAYTVIDDAHIALLDSMAGELDDFTDDSTLT